jgi:hypothetical protein
MHAQYTALRVLALLVASCAALLAYWRRDGALHVCASELRDKTYVRAFSAARDYSRAGLSHVTLHGAVHHGAHDVEIWQQAFAPGTGTPIHRHDCEEVFVILRGGGTLRTRTANLTFTANSTLHVARNEVHQLVNSQADEWLQVMVVIARPPIRVYVYDTWESRKAKLRFPYTWDAECPA